MFGQQSPFGAPNTGLGFNSSTTSTFGQPNTGFGAPSVFGASSTPFGGAPTSTPFGGGTTSAFGGTSNTFGQQSNPFGGAPTPTPFGASTGSGLFSNPAPSTGFGASTTPSPFGGTSGGMFGGNTGSTFGAPSQPTGGIFGSSTTSTFGAPAPSTGGFGNTGGSSLFGGSTPSPFGGGTGFGGPVPVGTGNPPYKPTQDTDSGANNTTVTVTQTCITAMPQYAAKSLEELRWDDYAAKKHLQGGSGLQSAFGQTTSNSSLFGGGSTGGFGSTSSGFGLPTSTTSPSLFGAQSTSAFGAPKPTTSLFGNTAPAQGGMFGNTGSTFGAPAQGGSLFGSAPTSASPFGGTSTGGLFGASSTGTGAFGSTQPTNSLFGGSTLGSTPNPSPFGAPSQGTGLFGAPSTGSSLFGNTGAPATTGFGATSTGTGLFGQPSAPATGGLFGSTPAPSTGGLFGNSAPATGGSLFGSAPSAPSTGGLFGNTAPATGGGLFGATTTAPSTGFGGFGGSSTAPTSNLFGSAPAPSTGGLFGASAPSTGGLFGSAPSTGGLFGNSTAPPTGSLFSSQPSTFPSSGGLFGNSQPQPNTGLFGATNLRPPTVDLMNPHGILPSVNVPLPASSPAPPVPTTDVGTQPSTIVTPNVLKSLKKLSSFGNTNTYRLTPSQKGPARNLFTNDDLKQDLSTSSSSITNFAPPKTPSTPGPLVAKSRTLRLEDEPETISAFKAVQDSQDLTATPQGSKKLQETPTSSKPKLYTVPILSSISNKRSVPDFVVGCEGYGYVKFLEPVDLTDVTMELINNIFIFSYGEVIVYPEEAHNRVPEGTGFNKPAQITLERVYSIDKRTKLPKLDQESLKRRHQELKSQTEELGAKFIAFVPETGEWVFEVQHFSRYGLKKTDDDEEDETPLPRGIVRQLPNQQTQTKAPLAKQLQFPVEPQPAVKPAKLETSEDVDDDIPVTTYDDDQEEAEPQPIEIETHDEAEQEEHEHEQHEDAFYPQPMHPFQYNVLAKHEMMAQQELFAQEEEEQEEEDHMEPVEPIDRPRILAPVFPQVAEPPVQQFQSLPVQQFSGQYPSRIQALYNRAVPSNTTAPKLSSAFADRPAWGARVAWGPNGVLFHLKNNNTKASVQQLPATVVSKKQLFVNPISSTEIYTRTMDVILNRVTIEAESGELPTVKFSANLLTDMLSLYVTKDSAPSFSSSSYEKYITHLERSALELIYALFSPDLGFPAEERNNFNQAELRSLEINGRRFAFDCWLKLQLEHLGNQHIEPPNAPKDLENGWLVTVFKLLAERELTKASRLCVANNAPNLALLIAQGSELCGTTTKGRTLLEQQLSQWKELQVVSGKDKTKDSACSMILHIVRLLSGKFETLPVKGFDTQVPLLKNFDWITALAQTMWYSSPPQQPIPDIVLQFQRSIRQSQVNPPAAPYITGFMKPMSSSLLPLNYTKPNTPLPTLAELAPEYSSILKLINSETCDIRFSILDLSKFGREKQEDKEKSFVVEETFKRTFENRWRSILQLVSDYHSMSPYPLDAFWVLPIYASLSSVLATTENWAEIEQEPQLVQLLAQKVKLLTLIAAQLEVLGLWERAVLVLLMIPSVPSLKLAKLKLVEDIILRHVSEANPSQLEYLQNLQLPAFLINRLKSWVAFGQGKIAEALVFAEQVKDAETLATWINEFGPKWTLILPEKCTEDILRAALTTARDQLSAGGIVCKRFLKKGHEEKWKRDAEEYASSLPMHNANQQLMIYYACFDHMSKLVSTE